MRKRRHLLAVAGTIALYLLNASWLALPPDGPGIRLIAHRGIHQTYHRENLENDTCTAERIYPPEHDYIENTVRSMQAAFEAGADIVELDVHPTTDGRLAVFHDWTVGCRTEGTGITREHTLASLKSLDIGYGYTADGGQTFPLRGTGVGLMPELTEVFSTFPAGRFLVNFKSRETREGDMLATLVNENPPWRSLVWGVYGGDNPTFRAKELLQDNLPAFSRRSVSDCLIRYIAFGWTGFMPDACKNTTVTIPVNVAPWMWGWPNRFLQRFDTAGSEVILLGPLESGDLDVISIDTPDQLAQVPSGFSGYVWTNRIEVIGPAVKRPGE